MATTHYRYSNGAPPQPGPYYTRRSTTKHVFNKDTGKVEVKPEPAKQPQCRSCGTTKGLKPDYLFGSRVWRCNSSGCVVF